MLRVIQRTLLVATIASLTFLVARVHPAHAQTAVTSCEQVVEGDAYLTGDLDCGPGTEAGVEIRSGGSLDMRDFSIHGGEYGVLCSDEGQIVDGSEVFRYTPCRVFGGGTIDGQSVVGIVASRLDLADVTVSSDASFALIIHKGLSFTNMSLQLGPTAVGIQAGDKAHLDGTGLTLAGGSLGIQSAGRVKIDGVTATGYGDFARNVKTVKLANASLTGGAHAINARVVTLTDSVVTGHSDTAIQAVRIRLKGSTVTGNGLDLHADYRPRLDESSTRQTSNGWGVCTND